MEAREFESARGRNHVGQTQLFLLRDQHAITSGKIKRTGYIGYIIYNIIYILVLRGSCVPIFS